LTARDVLRRCDKLRDQGRRGRYLIHDAPRPFGRLRRRP
jgi:hypothetical protein